MTRTRTTVHESSPNIFKDLGRPDAETHFLKAQLVAELLRLTKDHKLTQGKVADRMGITQPEVSRLFRGHFREYSVERLLRFLTSLDCDVEIVARPAASTSLKGRISFKTAKAAAAVAAKR